MNATVLSTIAGGLLSLLFSYVPGFKTWFDGLGRGVHGIYDGGTAKRLIMLELLVLVTGGIFALSCLGWAPGLGLTATCDQAGVFDLLTALIFAIMANQSVYSLSPRPKDRIE